jgi:signal transduction histidine kinase
VEDQGCGIAAEDLEKVFAKFQQVGEKKKGGTGLGLAICQALVMEHGGRIWVESELERGTRFIFRLPPAHRSVGAGA